MSDVKNISSTASEEAPPFGLYSLNELDRRQAWLNLDGLAWRLQEAPGAAHQLSRIAVVFGAPGEIRRPGDSCPSYGERWQAQLESGLRTRVDRPGEGVQLVVVDGRRWAFCYNEQLQRQQLFTGLFGVLSGETWEKPAGEDWDATTELTRCLRKATVSQLFVLVTHADEVASIERFLVWLEPQVRAHDAMKKSSWIFCGTRDFLHETPASTAVKLQPFFYFPCQVTRAEKQDAVPSKEATQSSRSEQDSLPVSTWDFRRIEGSEIPTGHEGLARLYLNAPPEALRRQLQSSVLERLNAVYQNNWERSRLNKKLAVLLARERVTLQEGSWSRSWTALMLADLVQPTADGTEVELRFPLLRRMMFDLPEFALGQQPSEDNIEGEFQRLAAKLTLPDPRPTLPPGTRLLSEVRNDWSSPLRCLALIEALSTWDEGRYDRVLSLPTPWSIAVKENALDDSASLEGRISPVLLAGRTFREAGRLAALWTRFLSPELAATWLKSSSAELEGSSWHTDTRDVMGRAQVFALALLTAWLLSGCLTPSQAARAITERGKEASAELGPPFFAAVSRVVRRGLGLTATPFDSISAFVRALKLPLEQARQRAGRTPKKAKAGPNSRSKALLGSPKPIGSKAPKSGKRKS